MYSRIARPAHPSDAVSTRMVWPVATAHSEDTLGDVAGALAEDEIGALAVLENDTLVGVISERDVVRHVASGAGLEHALARDLMSTDPVTVQADAPLSEAAELMREAGVRHLPVLKGDLIAGFLSIRDLFGMYVADSAARE